MVKKSLKDGKKSVVLFTLVFVVYALVYMTKNCYSAAMASIVSQGIMTKSETGLIAAAFYLIYAPFQIVGGIAADRYAPHRLIVLGMLGAGVCNLLVYLFAANYIAMLIIWSVNAVLQFGIWPSIFKVVASQLKENQRTRAVFYISLASTAGLVISYASAALISDWKWNFLLSTIVLFSSGTVFLLVYRYLSGHMTEDITPANTPTAKQGIKKGSLVMLVKAGIPLLLIVYTVQGILNLGLKSIVPVMLMENYPALSPSAANALSVILILCGVLGLFFARMRFFKKFDEPTSVAILFAAVLPLMLLMTRIGQIPLAIILIVLTLLMILASSMALFFSYISKSFERFGLSATLAGLFNCMAAVALVLTNYVFPRLVERFGWTFTTKSWLLLSAAALALSLVTIPLWKSFKRTYRSL